LQFGSSAELVLIDLVATDGDGRRITDLRPENASHAFWNNTWNSAQGFGVYWPDVNNTEVAAYTGGVFRGGYFDSATSAGVFAMDLWLNPSVDAYNYIGFRCVYREDM
jgi:hypothetical protein